MIRQIFDRNGIKTEVDVPVESHWRGEDDDSRERGRSLVAGQVLGDRLTALRARFDQAGVTALLVTHPANLFYLSNFRGSAGMLLVTRDEMSLVVDSRYTTAVETLLGSDAGCKGMALEQVASSYEETLRDLLDRCESSSVGIEASHMTVWRYEWLERALATSGVVLRPTTGFVEASRVVKDVFELATLGEAGVRISRVMERMLRSLEAGRTEREVAAGIDHAIQTAGFERPAFETIVASGPHTALPHAHPGDRVLAVGDLILLDFGGIYSGYCVDLTRMACLGAPGAAAVEWHEAVSEAHTAALATVRPGVRGSNVDAAARAVLDRRGFGGAFGHGTGHGIGLEVHEAPRINKRRKSIGAGQDPEDVLLESGMVFTVEPGVYLPGSGGVRLEDDLVVTPTGYELLTVVSRDLLVV